MRIQNEKISEQDAEYLLTVLIELEALEITIEDAPADPENMTKGKQDFLIPYMMNDAVEYYLRLTDCRIRGEWNPEETRAEGFSFVEDEGKKGLILRQAGGNTVSVWYEAMLRTACCYQYHRIGHMWRKTPGEEHWRRLVNLVCVLHDKHTYLGDAFCNELERELYPMAEFAPFLYYTPINDSISEWYEETDAGLDAMERLAKEAGDIKYEKLLLKYRKEAEPGEHKERRVEALAKELVHPEHLCIYQTLEKKLREASLSWECRDYGSEKNAMIEKKRQLAETYCKEIDGKPGETIDLVEQHPFTVSEEEGYEFQIFQMCVYEDGSCQMSRLDV